MAKQVRATKRLTGAERRAVILDVASRIFAEKGLHGATTKEIAKAAGISEPILYQHFKSKEDIYNALELMCSQQTAYFKQIVKDRGVGIDTLILITYLLIRVISYSKGPGEKSNPQDGKPAEILLRLMGHSFLDNGSFARSLVENCIGSFFDQWHESYQTALKNGHLTVDRADATTMWFAYEAIIGFGMFVLPSMRLVDKIKDIDEASKAATLFTLRGIGLKESVLKKEINWPELRKVYDQAMVAAGEAKV